MSNYMKDETLGEKLEAYRIAQIIVGFACSYDF